MWRILKWFRSCVGQNYVRVESDDDDDDTIYVIEEDFSDV